MVFSTPFYFSFIVTNFHNDLNTNNNSPKYFKGYRILNFNSEHQNDTMLPRSLKIFYLRIHIITMPKVSSSKIKQDHQATNFRTQ